MTIQMKMIFHKAILLSALLAMSYGAMAADTLRITLGDALRIALRDNPTIKVADQEITLKRVSRKEAYMNLLPEANGIGSYTRTLQKQSFAMEGRIIHIGMDNVFNGGVMINLPLFVPALYQAINLSKTDIELADEKARASRQDLVNQVSKAYFQLLLAQDSYCVLEKSYRQSEENYRIVKAKFDQGLVSEYDKISAEVQMRNLKPTWMAAGNGVKLAGLQLKVLMGMEADVPIFLKGKLGDYEQPMYADQLHPDSLTLDHNSQVRQLDLTAKQLDQNVKLQYTNFMPTLTTSFQYIYNTMTNDFKFNKYVWHPFSNIAFNLSIPLFKGSNFTKLKKAKLQRQSIAWTRDNTVRQLNVQANRYKDNMTTAIEQLESNKQAMAQAEKARDIAQRRYDVGMGTLLELNSSEVALTQARLAYNQTIFDYMTARADLELLTGNDNLSDKIKNN